MLRAWLIEITDLAPASTTPTIGTVETILEGIERSRGCGVAGNDDELHVVRSNEPLGDFVCVLGDLVQRLGTVRIAGRIADVHESFLREQVDQGPRDGQSTESAVEHADRSVIHGPILGAQSPFVA